MKKKEDTKKAYKYFTDQFNSKPFEDRKEIVAYTLQIQINQIKIERQRLLNTYRKADIEAREQQENCERDLRKYYKEQITKE